MTDRSTPVAWAWRQERPPRWLLRATLTVALGFLAVGLVWGMIAQLKEQALAQAKQQKGDPCSTEEVSRTQYTCAMASTTTSAWQKCLK